MSRRNRRLRHLPAKTAPRRPPAPTFTTYVRELEVGGRRLGHLVSRFDGQAPLQETDDNCPYCRALRTLEELDAAGDEASPELEQRAAEALAVLEAPLRGAVT